MMLLIAIILNMKVKQIITKLYQLKNVLIDNTIFERNNNSRRMESLFRH